MKTLFTILILVLIWTNAHADKRRHYDPPAPDPAPVTTTATAPLNLGLNYGLLALATSGNQFDWGVPEKIQLSVSGAFGEGGDQAVSFAVAKRFGGILVNAHAATTIDAPDNSADYVFVVSGTMRF